MKAASQVPSGVLISTLFSITSRPVPVMAALSPEESVARFDGGLRLKYPQIERQATMTARLFPRRQWILALALLQALPFAAAQSASKAKTGAANAASNTDAHWVATWASAQQQPAAGRGGRGAAGQ